MPSPATWVIFLPDSIKWRIEEQSLEKSENYRLGRILSIQCIRIQVNFISGLLEGCDHGEACILYFRSTDYIYFYSSITT